MLEESCLFRLPSLLYSRLCSLSNDVKARVLRPPSVVRVILPSLGRLMMMMSDTRRTKIFSSDLASLSSEGLIITASEAPREDATTTS